MMDPEKLAAHDRPQSSDPMTPRLDDALRWALDQSSDPAMASADWLAMDIDESHVSSTSLLNDSCVTLLQLRNANIAYKTMTIVGETSSDRRLGARLYAASIAAGLVWHGKRISRQSDEAIRRAFTGLLDDENMSEALRTLAGKALCVLEEHR